MTAPTPVLLDSGEVLSDSISIDFTGSQSGDLLVIHICNGDYYNNPYVAPDGTWTEQWNVNNQDAHCSACFTKKITSAETTVTVGAELSDTHVFAGFRIPNGAIDVVAATPNTGTDAAHVCPSVTTTGTDRTILAMSTQDQPGNITVDASTTELYSFVAVAGSLCAIACGYVAQASAGASGTYTNTSDDNDQWVASTIAVYDDGGSGPTAVSASAAQTLPTLITTVTAAEDFIGVLAQNLPLISQTIASIEQYNTNLVQDLPTLTQAATIVESFPATATQVVTLISQIIQTSVRAQIYGDIIQTVPAVTQTHAGVLSFESSVVQTLPNLQQHVTATKTELTVSTSIIQTIPFVTQTIIASEDFIATVTNNLYVPTQSLITDQIFNVQSIDSVLLNISLSITSKTGYPTQNTQQLPSIEQVATGTMTIPVTGTCTQTLTGLEQSVICTVSAFSSAASNIFHYGVGAWGVSWTAFILER